MAADSRPAILREVGFDQRLGESVPLDPELRDETGKLVRLQDYFGRRPVILSLAYYRCPMLCPMTLNGLVMGLGVVSLRLGDDYTVLTVSIDSRETADLAAEKKDLTVKRFSRPGAASGWHFLTGSEDSIRRLTESVGFRYAYDAARDQYAHPAGVVILTPQGRIARYLYGIEPAPRDLQLALVEASANQIGSLADQLLLFCYEYDPASGTYGAIALRAVRIGGVATVLALAAALGLSLRRERAGKGGR